MDAMEISDEKSLTAWLLDKPASWAQVIALRAAARALPLIATSSYEWLYEFSLLPFGAVLTSWVQLADRSIEVLKPGSRANARFGGENFDFVGYKSEQIASIAADSSYHSADAQTRSMHLISDCVKSVTKAAEAFRFAAIQESATRRAAKDKGQGAAQWHWECVAFDSDWLANFPKASAAEALAIKQLWYDSPKVWSSDWQQLRYKLLSLDRNYSVWIDWYERRIRGERAAFDIPGDKRRTEDKNILRQLAEASDEDFWDKGNHYVNATLKGWLDEARARAAPMPPVTAETHGTLEFDITAHAEIGPVPLPTQNLNSLSFRTNNEGRIAIDASALADKLRTDDDAMERHAEAISEARSALGRCQGNNAAARLTGFLENYLAAAGDSPGNAKPSLLVQRGERLRQELARYDASDHMLPPVADDVLLDLKGWQSAHNMMIALDPVLNANDTAMLGPDRQPVLIAPDEFREKVREADNQGLLAEGVVEIIDEAASLAPQTPDPTNRLSVSFGGMAQNLIIEAFACALNHPTISVVAIGAAGLISAGPAAGAIGGVSVMSSIKAAEYLINHREWIIARLGNAPTWQTLIERLVGWLETVTPFKPK